MALHPTTEVMCNTNTLIKWNQHSDYVAQLGVRLIHSPWQWECLLSWHNAVMELFNLPSRVPRCINASAAARTALSFHFPMLATALAIILFLSPHQDTAPRLPLPMHSTIASTAAPRDQPNARGDLPRKHATRLAST